MSEIGFPRRRGWKGAFCICDILAEALSGNRKKEPGEGVSREGISAGDMQKRGPMQCSGTNCTKELFPQGAGLLWPPAGSQRQDLPSSREEDTLLSWQDGAHQQKVSL